MNKNMLAKELLKIAKMLSSADDNTKIIEQAKTELQKINVAMNKIKNNELKGMAANHLSTGTNLIWKAMDAFDAAIKELK